MLKLIAQYSALLIMLAVFPGCIPDAPESEGETQAVRVQATPAQLVDILIQMSHSPDEFGDTPERHIHTQQLDAMGPTALAPLIDYMGAPDTEPAARLFILQCVSPYLTSAYISNVVALTKSEDTVTRAIGVNALGPIKHEYTVPLLQRALDDPQPRVAFSALSGLVLQGDADARQRMRDMYKEGSTMGDIPVEQVKREIVRVLVRNPSVEDLPVLSDALDEPFIEVNYRAAIAETLGRMGDASAIPLLEESVSLQTESGYEKMVNEAIAAIKEREGLA